jgi:ribosomal-protein-alanine N-acetyltransferase
MIRLTTERLIIRDPLSSDIDGWHRLLSDSGTMYYLPDIITRSLDESRQNLEAAVADVQNPDRTKYFLAIEDKTAGAFIGTVGYTVTANTPVGKLVGAGYFILPEYHGQGYMTEAFKDVIRFAFEDNAVYRISTGCLSENRASERVMQKCGLIKEAEYKSYVWHDGRMKDRVEYRLLKDEWRLK